MKAQLCESNSLYLSRDNLAQAQECSQVSDVQASDKVQDKHTVVRSTSGRLRMKTLPETHLLGFLTVAREEFSTVSFYMLLFKHEKNRNSVKFSCS